MTPSNTTSSYNVLSSRTTATKRDSLAAELERDPELSTAKRKQRTQAFTSNMAHASLERQLVAAQTTKMELETKLREKDLLVERLERDRRWFADREKEEREEKERERVEREEERRKIDMDLRSLRSALTTLREQHADLEDTHSTLSRTSSQTLASQKSQITTLTRQVAVLTQELEECRSIAEDRRRAVHEVQEQLDALREEDKMVLGGGANQDADMAVVREELHRQAGYLRTLESTNTRLESELRILRDRHTSVEVLREEKRGLEKRVRTFEEMQERVIRLEAEVEAGRKEREEWAKRSSENPTPSTTPISITQTLSALRLAHARLLEDHGANVALLRESEASLKDEEQRTTNAENAVSKLEIDVRTLNDQIRRREQRVLLADREVGFMQALVASFVAEEAAKEQDTTRIDEAKDQRVKELELLLGEYKSTNDTLVKEMDMFDNNTKRGLSGQGLSEDMQRERAAKFEVQRALEAAQAESSIHLEKIEELEQKLFDLGGEIGAGRHVPPGVRVLSMRDNPDQAWVDLRQSVMDQLRSENEALLRRLKVLEAAGAVAGGESADGRTDLVPRESWELVNREKNELQDVVKQKEKRLLRLQQVFTSKSAEFREAIASILGLKLAFYPNGQVRVTSVYDLCASFVFQPMATTKDESARMQLVAQGEGGPPELPQLMRYWIEEEQCLPGFLASVTMECYDRAKREGGSGSVGGNENILVG